MPPKRIKKPPVQPDPNRIPTRPKNAATHPGEVHTQCSNRRPESVIQAEKAEKAAKRARKEQKIIKQDEAAEAIAEYEQDMVINDTAEDAQFPRHRDKAGMSWSCHIPIFKLLLCPLNSTNRSESTSSSCWASEHIRHKEKDRREY